MPRHRDYDEHDYDKAVSLYHAGPMNRKMAHELTRKPGEIPGCFPTEPPETGPVNSSEHCNPSTGQ